MVELRKCTEADIHFVVDHVWDRGLAEAQLAGFPTKAALAEKLVGRVGNPYSFCLYGGGKPFAVCGAVEYAPNAYATWFFATDDFELYWKPATRLMRKFLEEQTEAHPEASLDVISASDHPKAGLWFQLLGFTLVERAGILHRYKYLRE